MTIAELQAGAPEVYQALWWKGYISEYVGLWQKYAAIYNVEPKPEVEIKPAPPPTPASMIYPIEPSDIAQCFPELAAAIEAAGRQAAGGEEERIKYRVMLARDLEFKQRILRYRQTHPENQSLKDTRQHPECRESSVAPPSPPPTPLTLEEQAEEDWKKDPHLRREFMNDKAVYLAYIRAKSEGRVRIYGG